ncbi:hypothetical protein NW766_010855 [Fusarium irregulare]|uniref:Bulb-type lectin domain-containing protein n=1 Tax=Fusarium irregulare TaxID=2494466 RepID=A0A9W8PHG7_9HYPO|nr:hypothetical protein NW766_010855 [Fusarium irregulare]
MGQLDNGSWMYPEDAVTSDNGRNVLKIEDDGRMCIYWDGEQVWGNTDEGRDDIKGLVLQDDGGFSTHDEEATWASNTEEHGDEVYLRVQDDGNVVLYKGEDDDAEAVWASNTMQAPEEEEEEE